MLNKTKIALSLAIVLGAASGATAATKHPVHRHQTVAERQVPAAALRSFGSAAGQNANGLPATNYGDPYNHEERKCFGGACGEDWGEFSGHD